MCPHAWKLRHSWIAVMIEEDTHSKTTTATSAEATQYYFLNQITGFTSWYAPEGWDEMIRFVGSNIHSSFMSFFLY